jgi:hypothetical protein
LTNSRSLLTSEIALRPRGKVRVRVKVRLGFRMKVWVKVRVQGYLLQLLEPSNAASMSQRTPKITL